MWKFDRYINDHQLKLESLKKSNMIDLIIEYSYWEISSNSLKEREREGDKEIIIKEKDLLISFKYWNLMNLIYFLIDKYILFWLLYILLFRIYL